MALFVFLNFTQFLFIFFVFQQPFFLLTSSKPAPPKVLRPIPPQAKQAHTRNNPFILL